VQIGKLLKGAIVTDHAVHQAISANQSVPGRKPAQPRDPKAGALQLKGTPLHKRHGLSSGAGEPCSSKSHRGPPRRDGACLGTSLGRLAEAAWRRLGGRGRGACHVGAPAALANTAAPLWHRVGLAPRRPARGQPSLNLPSVPYHTLPASLHLCGARNHHPSRWINGVLHRPVLPCPALQMGTRRTTALLLLALATSLDCCLPLARAVAGACDGVAPELLSKPEILDVMLWAEDCTEATAATLAAVSAHLAGGFMRLLMVARVAGNAADHNSDLPATHALPAVACLPGQPAPACPRLPPPARPPPPPTFLRTDSGRVPAALALPHHTPAPVLKSVCVGGGPHNNRKPST